MKLLTAEQHQQVLTNLVALAAKVEGVRFHSAGPEYTSLMSCFLLQSMSAATALLRLRSSYGNEWFPATVGYIIVRSMFESDVTAHYIAQAPADRSRQYIEFERVLRKREMDAYAKHRQSKDPQWRDAMDLMWQEVWAPLEDETDVRYEEVRSRFETVRGKAFQNWSGKSIRQMAIEVNHEEAYDIFYAELSSFTHVDVRLANRFLRIRPDGLSWSQRPTEFDVGNVFRHAATFLTCFLELFGEQFRRWTKEDVHNCWNV